MIKISKRLEAISSLVPYKSNAIDIGCDHGILDIYLYQNGICNKIIATDVNKNALSNAVENIKKYKLEEFIETRLGNGLDVLYEEDNIDTIIISGMGANTIIDILKNNIDKLNKIETIIIQSNTKLELLRRKITKLNYKIESELIIDDNKKTYVIIKFIKGKKRYSKKELYFGPDLLEKNSIEFQKHKNDELKKLQVLLKKIPKNKILERYKIKKEIKLYL